MKVLFVWVWLPFAISSQFELTMKLEQCWPRVSACIGFFTGILDSDIALCPEKSDINNFTAGVPHVAIQLHCFSQNI